MLINKSAAKNKVYFKKYRGKSKDYNKKAKSNRESKDYITNKYKGI